MASSSIPLSSQGSAPRAGGAAPRGARNQGRPIITGRGVNLPEARSGDLVDYLNNCGWGNFTNDFPQFYYPEIVREFYQNATFPRQVGSADPVLHTRVRGIQIILGVPEISQIFRIPNEGDKIYFKIRGLAENLLQGETLENFYFNLAGQPNVHGQMRNVDLLEDKRLINAYVRANVVPKSGGHTDEVPTYQAFVVHCLSTGRVLNLPYIVLKGMEHAVHVAGKSLPYGGFLNRIFEFCHVPILDDEPTERCDLPITENTITRQRVQKRSSRYRNEDPPPNLGDDHDIFNF